MSASENHHPNYVKIWVVLFVLLILGVGAGYVGHKTLSIFLIFGVAFVKAFIVAANYMHLKFEPYFVRLIAICGLAAIIILILGLVPDIVWVYGGTNELSGH